MTDKIISIKWINMALAFDLISACFLSGNKI